MKRISVGVLWFVVFWLAASVLWGIVTDMAGQSMPLPSGHPTAHAQAYALGAAVGRAIGGNLFIWIGALICAAVGTVTGVLPGTGSHGNDDA